MNQETPFFKYDVWEQLEDRQKTFELSQEFELETGLKWSNVSNLLAYYPTDIDMFEGKKTLSLDSKERLITTIYPNSKTSNSEVIQKHIGSVFVNQNDNIKKSHFIRFLGTEDGIYITSDELEILKSRAESELLEKQLQEESLMAHSFEMYG